MPYTMEFQTTGFIILVMLTVEFFSKKKMEIPPELHFQIYFDYFCFGYRL